MIWKVLIVVLILLLMVLLSIFLKGEIGGTTKNVIVNGNPLPMYTGPGPTSGYSYTRIDGRTTYHGIRQLNKKEIN